MNNLTQKEIFLGAFALVRNPQTWTRGTFARDKTGGKCELSSPEAVCFCSVGAIKKVSESYSRLHDNTNAWEVCKAISAQIQEKKTGWS